MSSEQVTTRPFVLKSTEESEWVACLLCGSEDSETVVVAPDRNTSGETGEQYQIVRCRQCGLCFQNPRPSPGRLVTCYPQDYYAYQLMTTPPKPLKGFRAVGKRVKQWSHMGLRRAFCGYPCPGGQAQRWALRLILWPLWVRMRWIRTWLHGKDERVIPYHGRGRFLDVGCGTGQELAYQRQYGLAVAGVEWNPSAARLAREQFELDVRTGTLEEAKFSERSFDVIYMSHVFEHLPNPALTLKEMHRILDTEGLIILKVPNLASRGAKRFGPYWLGLELPRHLYHFTPETITALLHRHEFVVTAIRHDHSSWSLWSGSRRLEAQQVRGQALNSSWWRDRFDQTLETMACWCGQGSVIVIYARKVDVPPNAHPHQ